MSINVPLRVTALALAMGAVLNANAATDTDQVMKEIEALKSRIQHLEQKLKDADQARQEAAAARREAQQAKAEAAAAKEQAGKSATASKSALASVKQGIKVHGAVRFQYTNERYNLGNRRRGGDFDFDIFRLNLDGKVGGVLLSAEWRWYQYMNAVHHAWVGYDFDKNDRVKAGITKVPFGILPYDSHNFFFSSNYYLGLEDDYDAGFNYHRKQGPWDLRLGFYLNDEMGGVDGYVSDRTHRYSYDVLGYRVAGEGIYDAPSKPLGENRTWNGRVAYTLADGDIWNLELGASLRYGLLNDGTSTAGDEDAYALHLVGNYGRWNLQLQAARYAYHVDAGADLMVVGAYAFYDTIAAKANTYTANLAYGLPVSWGPITKLTFYNDYSLVTDKSASLADTWMNVTGVAVSAGDLYTYIDFVSAQNQPFIGGSMAGNSHQTEHRFNINFGYYF